MILVRMRYENCIKFPATDGFEVRQSSVPFVLGMHAAIEHNAAIFRFQIVGVRANLSRTRQVDEFQGNFLLPSRLDRSFDASRSSRLLS
jgi:hypothetical protein